MFTDRTDAGNQLKDKLTGFADEEVVVLAIPRGGLPVAAIVAKSLNAPLDVALIKKLGHPDNKEYAIGAISLYNVVINDDAGISKAYIDDEIQRLRQVLKKRRDQYYQSSSPKSLLEKVVIIVDDGIATGSTVLATIELVAQQKPTKIVVATPVAPLTTMSRLEDVPQVDEVVCLQTPLDFHAVGQYYQNFGQISDEEAIAILKTANT